MNFKTALILFLLLAMCSCGPRRKGPEGLIGPTGAAGNNGQNGLSLVVNITNLELESGVACKQTDIYQDIDRDSTYSAADVFNNGFLICDGAAGLNGQDGTNGEDGADGQDGQNGSDGADGQDGQAGADGQNGTNGQDGLNANSAYSIVAIIDPCGDGAGFDEVLLQLADGRYVASFSENKNGKNTRLSVLPAGNYETTDDTGCHFSIDATGTVSW